MTAISANAPIFSRPPSDCRLPNIRYRLDLVCLPKRFNNTTETRVAKAEALLGRRLNDQLLTAMTTLLSLLLFVVAPLQANGIISGTSFGIMFGLILIPAGFMVSGSGVAVGAILLAFTLVLTAAIRQGTIVDKYLDVVSWLIVGLTLSIVVARAVFAPGKVTYHRIIGGVLLYLTIGLTFVALFGLLVLLEPNVFTNLSSFQGNFGVGTLIYFSFVTLTTIGYGDIVPLHPYARSLANVEAVIGQLYPATLLARLVTLELAIRRN
jgi:Ion channel